jgi:flavin-dependent dehydrogenase
MEEVRLGRFTARLQALASGAGARLLGEMPLAGLGAMDRAAEEKGPILASLPGKEVLARLVVDATGLTGVGRATWPALARACPPVDPTDLCLARQEDREVKDPVALRAWLGEQGVFGDDALSLTASFGGWSVEVLQWHAPFMGLLGGSIPGRGAPGGPELVRRLAARTPGLGAVTGHGEGWIPLRRPYDRLSAGPVLLLGSSACQVYASNACGVASGLLGARMLGTCLVGSSWEPAASAWRYACLFQRHWGGFLAGSTTTVDMAASLGQEGLERALSSGLLTPSLMEGGYGHRTRMPPPREWGALLRGMGREPGLARRVLEVPLRVSAIRAVYGTYPSSPTPGALSRWAARAAAVGNWEADPVE